MGTVVLHHGGSAQDFALEEPPISQQERSKFFVNAQRLLGARGLDEAKDLLQAAAFDIYPATNHFNDDFYVLYAEVPLSEYESFRARQPLLRHPASQIAEAIMESSGLYIRFVAVGFEQLAPKDWEVFLCHASEDKENIVRPLFRSLKQAGIRCWYDEVEIRWGQSIVRAIQAGLASSRYIVVVVSEHLARKRWAQEELQSALHLETSGADTMVLPLVVGTPDHVLRELPFLAEKKDLVWDGDPDEVVRKLREIRYRR